MTRPVERGEPMDEFEARVRDSLQRDGEQIRPDDGLTRIRERTSARDRWTDRRRLWLITGSAALATAAAVAGAIVVSGDLVDRSSAPAPVDTPSATVAPSPSDDAPTPTPAPSSTQTPTPAPSSSHAAPTPSPSPSSSTDPSPTASPSSSTDPGPTASPSSSTDPSSTASPSSSTDPTPPPTVTELTVPVYYLGGSTSGSRLFREFHAVETADSIGVAALDQMFGQAPHDPDYSSPWPTGSHALSVEQTAGLITVDLSSRVLDTAVPAAKADLVVQQLVYTVQAALQSTDPVQVLVEGGHVSDISGSATSEPLGRADALDVQAMTWITTPLQNGAVPRTFTVTGIANAFEAGVSWRLLDGNRVVEEGFAMAAEGMVFSPYSFVVKDVPTGSYTLEVFQRSPRDGSQLFVDSKDITVG